MAATLTFNREFDPQTGVAVPVCAGLVRITAPNSSPYTFTGTNSFLLGHERLALVDPGPDDATHLAALHAAMAGRALEAIILTHTHRDHSAAAARLGRQYDVPIWFGGRHRLSRPLRRFERNVLRKSCDWDLVPDRILIDGETIAAGDVRISVHTTPGHCANHLAFGYGDVLLSGDHVMGWNSTLVSVPDGSMADYFASLDKVIALPQQRYVPAHGGAIENGPGFARALKAHRHMRNGQVLAAIADGAHSISALVSAIYPCQSLPVRMAARMTIAAHVEYLENLGQLSVSRRPWGTRIRAS
ncbi:MBL fold metallo-hydrolase [Devosia neptuniae]|jgi:glyoxylase-like metal-dependent hydrolase (beta-lactamase superfamily II)|uniref:MBL fold metallo-hydrolase n=1 Tax=Devosia TaxID=46913 RepID=UPI0022AF0AB6|nr:MBL fold metallo-hydrolase [Devosia neptuniae]MCZ4344717.1 MBL fold metallo-hydrolase [Devosia neptuniae]|tara:strand:+ start:55725 stop:56627 length:903 start_codon:yes stop_codon:yes gene_type:complete